MNLDKDQLFCILGNNGDGKNNDINCLNGITTVTSGDGIHYKVTLRIFTFLVKISFL